MRKEATIPNDKFTMRVGAIAGALAVVTSAAETRAANQAGAIAILVMVEGMHTLRGKVERIEALYDHGVRIMAPTCNYSNEFATCV